MIVVKIELWPFGNEANKRDIGTIEIGNVGGDMQTGEYDIRMFEGNRTLKWAGMLTGFPRMMCDAWDLVGRALYDSHPGSRLKCIKVNGGVVK